jgi:hypothetical protein
MKSLHKLSPGNGIKKISASTWNEFVQAADRSLRRKPLGTPNAQGLPHQAVILIRNDSGDNRDRFDILGLDDILIDPADNEVVFANMQAMVGVTPTSDHLGMFAILLEPVAGGGIGRALLMGVTAVKVDIVDSSHAFADVDDGECGNLISGFAGSAEILWKEVGAGVKWAVVRFGGGGGGGAGGVFDVYLEQNGGSNGSAGVSFPTYTYDVFMDAGHTIQIGTAVAVRFNRRMKLEVTAAEHGFARYEGSDLVLLDVDEVWCATT